MLLVIDFGSRCDPNVSETPWSGYGGLVKNCSFGLFWPILYAITQSFWVPLRSKRYGTPGSGYGELVKTRSIGLLWLVLYAITH